MNIETKEQADLTPTIHTQRGGTLVMTPPIGGGYWKYRVVLSDKQAIVGFPKFFTIGIGFQNEEYDGNTNLPYTKDAEIIFNHIADNKGDDSISDQDCIAAIKLIQDTVRKERAVQP